MNKAQRQVLRSAASTAHIEGHELDVGFASGLAVGLAATRMAVMGKSDEAFKLLAQFAVSVGDIASPDNMLILAETYALSGLAKKGGCNDAGLN